MNNTDHFALLRERVESVFGRSADTTMAFVALSKDIERRTGELLSASTLKRFWGYVPSRTNLSASSLDILARYAGFSSFAAFCTGDSSIYLDAESVSARALPLQAEVEVCWNPGRKLRLLHLGNGAFRVVSAERSKLQAGDCFEVADFIVGFPLYLGRVFREGQELPPYVAGATGGLTSCSVATAKH